MITRKANYSLIVLLAINAGKLGHSAFSQAPVCPVIGKVSSTKKDVVTVTRDGNPVKVRITPNTLMESADARMPKSGDFVMVDCLPEALEVVSATVVTVNAVRYAGTITSVGAGEIEIVGDGGAGEAPGHLRVSIGPKTHYVQGSQADLRIGRDVEVTGFDRGHKSIQATALNVWPLK